MRIVFNAVCNEEKVGTSAFLPKLRAQGVAHIASTTLAGGFSSDLANEETLLMLAVGSRLFDGGGNVYADAIATALLLAV